MRITRTLKRILADAWSCRSPKAQERREQTLVYEALLWVLTRQGNMPPLKGPVDDSNGGRS